MSLMDGFKVIRSLDARVNSLLSSMTEFMDSIQLAYYFETIHETHL
jgi:hypothetical protein